MASYEEWSQSLVAYFVGSAPLGSTIYLSVDDDVIAEIGRGLPLTDRDAVSDFIKAIRTRMISSNHVYPRAVKGRASEGAPPRCVPFLAAMVLAASRMADDETEEVTERNYFRRLREVLGLPAGPGRPSGLRHGGDSEEPLWLSWMQWLQEKGYLPSARRGKGARTYINYPISQTLLRRADKDRLRRLFTDRHFATDWDMDTVMLHLKRETHHLRQHMQVLFALRGARRLAVAEAIYDVYEAWTVGSQGVDGLAQGGRDRTLIGSLMRIEDSIAGTVDYYLYPRRPRREANLSIEVQWNDQSHELREDRPGWYMPLGPLDGNALNLSTRYPIRQPDHLEAVLLPRRDFWVLTNDADNPESGTYAGWGKIQWGEPFMLLFRKELLTDLRALRSAGVLDWSGEPRPVFGGRVWLEIQRAMVLAEVADAPIQNVDLWEALQPSAALSISVSGGLRIPNLNAWLDGYGPQITIFSFQPLADVEVIQSADESLVTRLSTATNIPFPISWPGPGVYRIEASVANEAAARRVEIARWDQLQTSPLHEYVTIQIGAIEISGSRIRVR